MTSVISPAIDINSTPVVVNPRLVRKTRFLGSFERIINNYASALIVHIDGVGSNQLQQTRIALRNRAELVFGKHTLMRKIIRSLIENQPHLINLLPHTTGNMGFVFTNETSTTGLIEIVKILTNNKVSTMAKVGSRASNNVIIPSGPTGLDPSQTGFFQSLNISTKIVRGCIEIMSNVHLLREGDKITESHATLLKKLNIKPFYRGFNITAVYQDGTVYDSKMLLQFVNDNGKNLLTNKLFNGLNTLAALAIGGNYNPTESNELVNYIDLAQRIPIQLSNINTVVNTSNNSAAQDNNQEDANDSDDCCCNCDLLFDF